LSIAETFWTESIPGNHSDQWLGFVSVAQTSSTGASISVFRSNFGISSVPFLFINALFSSLNRDIDAFFASYGPGLDLIRPYLLKKLKFLDTIYLIL